MSKSIFVAATGQNVGKTTLCLGLMAGLRKKFDKVGFIKPVGQQHLQVAENVKADKDVVLFKNYFDLPQDFSSMSPVILPAGFTRSYLDGEISNHDMQQKIIRGYEKIAADSDFMLVEGTGHVGVGSIVDLCNAKVAKLLNLKVIIIAEGGLGSAFDELVLNINLCKSFGVEVAGVILNRVLPGKLSMVKNYISKALRKLQIPLLGTVVYNELLSLPTLKDFEQLFKTNLMAGLSKKNSHFPHHRLVAGAVEVFRQDELKENEMIITPATREDIIFETINKHRESKSSHALILTGKHPPQTKVVELIKSVDIPVIYAPLCSYEAMQLLTSHVAKINAEDSLKIKQAIEVTETGIDLDLLLNVI